MLPVKVTEKAERVRVAKLLADSAAMPHQPRSRSAVRPIVCFTAGSPCMHVPWRPAVERLRPYQEVGYQRCVLWAVFSLTSASQSLFRESQRPGCVHEHEHGLLKHFSSGRRTRQCSKSIWKDWLQFVTPVQVQLSEKNKAVR